MTDEDMFEPAETAPEYGISGGRYRFPAPSGERNNPRGWMRMTNLVSAFSDQERLQLWLEWKTMIGLREADGLLVDEWLSERVDHLDDQAQKALANEYAERARLAARADAAARRGTARHTMMHTYFSTGARNGTRHMLASLDQVVALLDKADLEILDQEFKVWHPAAGGTMGTADARVLCRRTGQIGILDWKTQARFWTFQEIAGQLYGYDSARWQWCGPEGRGGEWWPIETVLSTPNGHTLTGHPDGNHPGKRVALVVHMPVSGAEPELYEVDMDYGRRVLQTAALNVELRSIGKSVALGRRPASVRPR